MKKIDITIIGAGPAGISCALLIASASKKMVDLSKKQILVIDSGFSDTNRAEFNNVTGVDIGTNGPSLLENANRQMQHYPNITILNGVAKSAKREIIDSKTSFEIEYIDKSEKNRFKVNTEYLVLASGFRSLNLKGLNLETVQFPRSTNQTRVMIRNNDLKISPKLFVCGLLSGCSSQWDVASGTGSQVGVHIISEWLGKWAVVHDKLNQHQKE